MSGCWAIAKHYKKLPNHHLEELWNQVHQKNVRGEELREILMFYIHHQLIPPPLQKSYDTLLMAFSAKSTSKKLRLVILHVFEEICSFLESSLLQTVSFSSDYKVVTDLLNSVLICGLGPQVGLDCITNLCSSVVSPKVSAEDQVKILMFFCHGVGGGLPKDVLLKLTIHLATRLRVNQGTTPGRRILKSDAKGTEVDGSPAGDFFTVLTLVNKFSEDQLLSSYTFASFRKWLEMLSSLEEERISQLETAFKVGFDTVREYCSRVVDQCFRAAQDEQDAELQKVILCEVVDLLNKLVQLYKPQELQCLQIVKRIQSNVMQKFKSDYRDVAIFVRVLKFFLYFGESTGYTSQHFSEEFFGDIVYRSYSSNVAAFEVTTFIVDNIERLSSYHLVIARYFPNLLKLVANHPSVLVEEFLEIVPVMVTKNTALEVFHSLLDLPVLSATLLLHQAPTLFRLEGSGAAVPWPALLEAIRNPPYRSMFSYMIRIESGHGDTFNKLELYLELIAELCSHPLVVTSSEIVPVLLQAYLAAISDLGSDDIYSTLLSAIIDRMGLLYAVPNYSASIKKFLSNEVKNIFKSCPQLVFTLQREMLDYVSVLQNCSVCEDFYIHIVWAIGEFASPAYRSECSPEEMLKYHEAIECVLYEILAHPNLQNVSLKLVCVLSSSLTKLASRCQDLIPRVLLCLTKVSSQAASMKNLSPDEKQVVAKRMEELICFLRNPNIASVIMSPSQDDTEAMFTMLRIVAQFADV